LEAADYLRANSKLNYSDYFMPGGFIMSSGVFRKGTRARRCSLQHIDQILGAGPKTSWRDEMNSRRRVKLVREGQYIAEVEVVLIEDDTGWSPYLSLEDAYKLDDVRAALRRRDIKAAANLARVFELRQVASP
jgi:hypothetical protein